MYITISHSTLVQSHFIRRLIAITCVLTVDHGPAIQKRPQVSLLQPFSESGLLCGGHAVLSLPVPLIHCT